MKKRIITSIILAIIFCIIMIIASSMNDIVASQAASENYTKEQLVQFIIEAQKTKDNAHSMAENARALGWEEDDKLIKNLQSRWVAADKDQQKFQSLLDEILVNEAEAARKAEEERLAAEAAQKSAEEEARRVEEAKWAIKAAEYPAAT